MSSRDKNGRRTLKNITKSGSAMTTAADEWRDGNAYSKLVSVAEMDKDNMGDFGASTKKALKQCKRALARMRVAVLRSIKSLIHDRVPTRSRRAMESRYADLLRRVKQTLAAVEAATVAADECTSPTPKAAVLLADVYRLENELNDANNERDRLVASGCIGSNGIGQLS